MILASVLTQPGAEKVPMESEKGGSHERRHSVIPTASPSSHQDRSRRFIKFRKIFKSFFFENLVQAERKMRLETIVPEN